MKWYRSILASVTTLLILLVAGCAPQNYQVSVSSAPNGSGTVSPLGGVYQGGTNVTFVATPANNYKFTGWAGSISGTDNPLTIKVNSDKQIVASFAKIQYSLQIQVMPAGGGTVTPGNEMYDAGTQLTVTATADNGYRFDHWSGDVTGNSPSSTISINSNRTATAYFIKVYKLTVNAPPDVGATVSPGNGSYNAGTSVNITAKATICPYAFDHWSGTINDKVNPTTVLLDSDKTVNVYFKKLVADQPITKNETIWGGGSTNISIDLTQNEWVQGEFWGPYFTVNIQDPNGTTIQNVRSNNFSFNAAIPGKYIIALYNSNTLTAAAYNLTYTVYR